MLLFLTSDQRCPPGWAAQGTGCSLLLLEREVTTPASLCAGLRTTTLSSGLDLVVPIVLEGWTTQSQEHF